MPFKQNDVSFHRSHMVPWEHGNGEQTVLGSPAQSAEGDDSSRPPTGCTDD